MQEGISANFGRKGLKDLLFKRGHQCFIITEISNSNFILYSGYSINGRPLSEYPLYLDKRPKPENIEFKIFFCCCCFQIPIIKVDSNQKLGEWAGLCKLDAEGKARKVVRCSSVVVRDWGKESPAHDIIKDYIKSQH
jgi:hypothetical protein